MKTQQSELLTQFYQAYLAWVVAGAPTNHPRFTRRYGLCANLIEWADEEGSIDMLTDQFQASGLDWLYPFNDNPDEYKLETANQTHHLNEARMQWVRDHAAEVS